MNLEIAKGVWTELKGWFTKLWGTLTHDKTAQTDGRLLWLSGLIQVHNGQHMAQVRREVHACLRRSKHQSDMY